MRTFLTKVIMRRMDGSVDFNRGWEDYKYGFGQITGEYWAGNLHCSMFYCCNFLWKITITIRQSFDSVLYNIFNIHNLGNENLYKSTSGKRIYSLRVDLVSYDGDECYALYKYFRIGPELDGYRLHVEGYEHYSTLGKTVISVRRLIIAI